MVNVTAQSDPDGPSETLITQYPSENLASRVYPWPDEAGNSSADSRIIASGGTTHLRSLKIRSITLKGNQFLPANDIEESENLIIIKEGQLSISIRDDQKELGPASIALILPGDRYTIENLRDKPAVCYLLEFQSKSPLNLVRGQESGGSFMVDWNEIEYKEHGKGGRRDFFDRPTAMCEDFEMHVTNLNENTSSHDPHTHEVEEIILMVQGDISMHIDGKETEAGIGDFAFVDSNVPHAPTNIGSGQAIYFAFQWK